jgi:hypothetical protein
VAELRHNLVDKEKMVDITRLSKASIRPIEDWKLKMCDYMLQDKKRDDKLNQSGNGGCAGGT